MVYLVVVLVFCVEINGVMHVYILAWIDGPCLFHSPTVVIFQCTVSFPVCGEFVIFFQCCFEVYGMLSFWIPYPKVIDNQGEINWAIFLCPWYQGLVWGMVSIRCQILDKGIAWNSSWLWDSIYPLGYRCKYVSILGLVIEIIFINS